MTTPSWRVTVSGTALSLLMSALLPATAHHSHAMFEADKEVSITGTIKEFQFTNPHSWLLVVAKSDGKLWSFETQPPSILARGGIRRSMLTPGELVTVVANPLRDGRAGGEITMITKGDGTVLSRAMFGRNAAAARAAAAASAGE